MKSKHHLDFACVVANSIRPISSKFLMNDLELLYQYSSVKPRLSGILIKRR
ncbi:hypothetical protein [Anabaena azotica]|uniref:Uncharacterized protein n=1 Tax=Anabaena azotica FACHB-119 TaxID=947527 RepID=A0ABR8D373_9NOST|nr:hypothetical protein [Anabaena azotica]MBD2501588.1 hypothetical protein [Anabaena azotica FACHB-119]